MERKTEDQQPFLGFRDDTKTPELTDDNTTDVDSSHHYHQQQACKLCRRPRLLRDVVVCLGTSLFWIVVFYFLMPSPRTNPSSASTDARIEWSPDHNFIAQYHNVTSNAELVTCGDTLAEAKESGCVYDTLLNHWVPAQCYDREFVIEYEDDNSWTAFSDFNLTQRIPVERMGEYESYYTSVRDHVNHCSMIWKKQFWTLFEDRKVFDSVISNTAHTEHCADFLRDIYVSDRTEPTRVEVGFAECWVKRN
ncbi:hypothetical protein CCHL11_07200 [Colletotrichum chlorophyti]|uniref:Uncharacterized protein n=1 Tax=Colletotrichum chlorophyti TaxID=708187 RepID=A0A1Q8S0U2_9PEZI|nr:hypothetical protein CCHL11_07200 [Colletotrichum chlorophyti]